MRAVLLVLVGVLIGANLVYFGLTRDRTPVRYSSAASGTAPAMQATPAAPTRTADMAAPTSTAAAAAAPSSHVTSTTSAAPAPVLAMPLAGLQPGQLHDTFNEARGSERSHEALDILAPAGTPVYAVADGHVEKLFTSVRGGLTVYQFEPSGRYVYYYAHLQDYAPGLREKQQLHRGDLIGHVGSTGNANPSAPHLHFAVFELGPERQWWKGTAINPYPLLGGATPAR